MKLHIINTIWGKEFTYVFLNISLLSQFTEKNLIYLHKNKISAKYIIYTTQSDALIMEKHSSFKKLKKLIEVEFVFISINPNKHKYDNMNNCHNHALQRSYDDKSILIFLAPDVICSNNIFFELHELIKKDYRVVLVSAIRLAKQNFVKHIKKNFSTINFSPRQLVKTALPFIHPSIKYSFDKEQKIPTYSAQIFWKIDPYNLLIKCFHFHPLLIWPEKKILLSSNIDSFFHKICPTFEKRIIIDDSDKFVLFELTNQNKHVHGKLKKRYFWSQAMWCAKQKDTFDWKYLNKNIYLKSTDNQKYLKDIKILANKTIKKTKFLSRIFKIIWLGYQTLLKIKSFTLKCIRLLQKYIRLLNVLVLIKKHTYYVILTLLKILILTKKYTYYAILTLLKILILTKRYTYYAISTLLKTLIPTKAYSNSKIKYSTNFSRKKIQQKIK